jgi:hypothetical protein
VSGAGEPHEVGTGAPPGPDAAAGGLASALAATRARGPRPPPRRRRSRVAWVAVGAAAVAVVLIGALLLGSFFGVQLTSPSHGTPGGTGGSGGPSTFYGALPSANTAARALFWDWPPSGEPPLVFAEGLASPTALAAVANATHLGIAGCAPTLLTMPIAGLPAFNGSLTAGLAPAWLYAYSTTAAALLVLAVVNGTATIVATLPSMGPCYSGPGSFSTVVVDSSVAASAAGATSVSKAFLRDAAVNGTAVSADFSLVPPGYVPHSPLDPMWLVNDTSCPLYGGAAVAGTALASVVNAATGALYSQSSVSVTC